jgi:hypothetical protein
MDDVIVIIILVLINVLDRRQRIELQGFDWFALADSGSVRVDKDGGGLWQLWVDQLLQFSSVGMDIANAIASKYPSPRLLLEVGSDLYNMQN